MSDLGCSSFDPDVSSLVSFVEQSSRDLEEKSSSLGADSGGALAAEAARTVSVALLPVCIKDVFRQSGRP